METALLVCLYYGLLAPLNPADGQPLRMPVAPPDSLRPQVATVLTDSVPAATPAIHVTGELGILTGFNASRGSASAQKQWMPADLSATVVLTTPTGWVVPLRLLGSSQNSRYRQPDNQIGLSAHYKNWLTLHTGYSNVQFSPLTLAGQPFLGVGAVINPGLLRAGVVAGRFSRAVEVDGTDPNRIAAFRRMGVGAKVGVGNAHSYLDLILLRIADDARSLRTDSLTPLTPAENLVLGLSGRLKLRRTLTAELDIAGSAFSCDSRSEPTFSPSDSDRLRYLSPFRRLFTVRSSTQVYTAVQASLQYRGKWADLKLQYRRTEPGYKSLGTYYVPGDIEQATITPTFRLAKKRLAKKRLALRSSFGWQHDNLFNQKKARLDRLIGSVMVSYVSTTDLTLELSVANYGLAQRAGYRPLNDTVRLLQSNRTLSGNVLKNWVNPERIHTLTASATYQELRDRNRFTAAMNASRNWSHTLSYTYQQLTAHLDLTLGYQYTHMKAVAIDSRYYGPMLSAGKKLLSRSQLNLLVTASYVTSRDVFSGLDQAGSTFGTSLTIDYQVSSAHRLSIGLSDSLTEGTHRFRTQQGTIQYLTTF